MPVRHLARAFGAVLAAVGMFAGPRTAQAGTGADRMTDTKAGRQT